MRVPWTARRSNQFILKGDQSWVVTGRTDVKLKLQYVGHLMQRTDSFEKTLMLGNIKGGRKRVQQRIDGWMASLINRHEFEYALGVGDGQGGLACCSPWGCKESETTETELTGIQKFQFKLYDLSTFHLALENIFFWE